MDGLKLLAKKTPKITKWKRTKNLDRSSKNIQIWYRDGISWRTFIILLIKIEKDK